MLVIAGKDDPVIRSEKKFKELIDFLRKLGYVDVRSRLYGDMRHEILNEINKQDVYCDIVRFLDENDLQQSRRY